MPQGSLGGPIKNADGWSRIEICAKENGISDERPPFGESSGCLWQVSMAEYGPQHILSPGIAAATGVYSAYNMQETVL